MSFASLPFVGLVAAGVILYYLVPQKLQWVVLLLASMVFYLAGGVKSAVWLVLVAAVTWLTGLLLARQNARPAPDKQTKAAVRHVKKRICAVCAVLCFGLLYLMKYWNFTASALPSALFHLSGRRLRDRRVPRKDGRAEKPSSLRPVRLLLPADGTGAHQPL